MRHMIHINKYNMVFAPIFLLLPATISAVAYCEFWTFGGFNFIRNGVNMTQGVMPQLQVTSLLGCAMVCSANFGSPFHCQGFLFNKTRKECTMLENGQWQPCCSRGQCSELAFIKVELCVYV